MSNCIAASNAECCFLNIRRIIQSFLRTSQTCTPGFAVKIATRLKSSQLLLPPLVHYPRLIPGPPLFCQPLLTGLQKSISCATCWEMHASKCPSHFNYHRGVASRRFLWIMCAVSGKAGCDSSMTRFRSRTLWNLLVSVHRDWGSVLFSQTCKAPSHVRLKWTKGCFVIAALKYIFS